MLPPRDLLTPCSRSLVVAAEVAEIPLCTSTRCLVNLRSRHRYWANASSSSVPDAGLTVARPGALRSRAHTGLRAFMGFDVILPVEKTLAAEGKTSKPSAHRRRSATAAAHALTGQHSRAAAPGRHQAEYARIRRALSGSPTQSGLDLAGAVAAGLKKLARSQESPAQRAPSLSTRHNQGAESATVREHGRQLQPKSEISPAAGVCAQRRKSRACSGLLAIAPMEFWSLDSRDCPFACTLNWYRRLCRYA
jgi:hypothetical protein